MRTNAFVHGVIVSVLLLVGAYSFAGDKDKYGFYVPGPNEEIFGTWVNTEYSGDVMSASPQKFVEYRWGSYEVYMLASLKTPSFKGSGILVDKWKDAKGNSLYKMYAREDGSTAGFFKLERISADGKSREFVWRKDNFPTEKELNSKDTVTLHYRIYYRQ